MKGSDLAALINRGKCPVVTFNESAQGPMTYIEAGMRARLIGCFEKYEDTLAFVADLSEFEGHNKTLETPNYKDSSGHHRLTAREAGKYQQQIEVFVGTDDIKEFDVEGESVELFTEYVASGSPDPYALWLEKQLLAVRELA